MITDHLYVIERLISSLYPLEEKALNITCDTTSHLSKMHIMKQKEVGSNPKTKRWVTGTSDLSHLPQTSRGEEEEEEERRENCYTHQLCGAPLPDRSEACSKLARGSGPWITTRISRATQPNLLHFSATLRITESKKGGCNRRLQAQEMSLRPNASLLLNETINVLWMKKTIFILL